MPFNYSLYTIPVAWVLASSPQGYAMWTFNACKAPGSKGWNNAQPRSNMTPESFKSNQIPANVAARIVRASSASSNGLENLALYAAGVVVANYARIAPETLNTLCLAYLLSRAAYNICYITTSSQSWSHLRSIVFYVGHVIVMSLFIMSGKALSTDHT